MNARERNCICWNDSQEVISPYAARRLTSTWAGLEHICEKTDRVLQGHLYLAWVHCWAAHLEESCMLTGIWIQTSEQNNPSRINSSVHSRGCKTGSLESGRCFATEKSQFLASNHCCFPPLLYSKLLLCLNYSYFLYYCALFNIFYL